jgi:glutamine amidotransferase
MNTIAIIDYGMGNLHSVAKAIEHSSVASKVIVTHDRKTILSADRIVLPGVGAMRDCMGEIKRLELDDVIREVAQNKPFLGVCVGMQALLDSSTENDGVECLGILPGHVEFFGNPLVDENNERLKVPHMGWNKVTQKIEHALWKDIPQDARFYFVHSYYVSPSDDNHEAASTSYGNTFTSAVAHENIFAVQFHPEKSQHAGLKLYENFIRWDGHADV